VSASTQARGRISAGAGIGASTWGAYAVVEEAFCTVRPLLGNAYDVTPAWHWGPLIQLYAAYVLLGALAGAAAAAVVSALHPACEDQAEHNAQVGHAVMLLLTSWMIWLTGGLDDKSLAEQAAQAAALCAVVVTLVGIFRPKTRWVRTVATPWVLSVAYLGAHWIGHAVLPRNSMASVMLHVAALATALVAVAVLGGRFLPWPGANPLRQGFATAGAMTGAAVVAVALTQPPPSVATEIGAQPEESRRPNIVLVTLDTVRADHLSVYGYSRPTTPFLEDLAEDSTVFTRAIGTSNHTLPTHASIMTGQYPRQHGAHFLPPVFSAGRPLTENAETLAEILSESGYQTYAAIANVGYLRPEYGIDQGFDHFDDTQPIPILWTNERHYLRNQLREVIGLFTSTLEFDRVTRTAREITQTAIHYVDGLSRQPAPFFLFLNYMDAHAPYLPQPPFDSLFGVKDGRFTMAALQEASRRVVQRRGALTDDEYRHYTSQYDGGIAAIDAQLRLLVEALREAGVYENTIIVITADHGEAFGEQQLMGHGESTYQTQTGIPMIVKRAGERAAGIIERPVSQVDVLPTLLDLAGSEVPYAIGGVGMFSAEQERPVFSEAFARDLEHPSEHERAAVKGSAKLILRDGASPELYDLDGDPGELRNLYEAGVARAGQLAQEIERWTSETPPAAESSPDPTAPGVIDLLKSLGYIQ